MISKHAMAYISMYRSQGRRRSDKGVPATGRAMQKIAKKEVEDTMRESRYLKDDADNIQKLISIPIFKDFETRLLGSLLKLSRIREYKDGERIIREGDLDQWLYFLLSGQVRIMKGEKQLQTLKRRGDVFGEMGMLGGLDRSASVFAVGATTCMTTDAARVKDVAGTDRVSFGYILYRVFAEIVTERLRNTSADLAKAQETIARLEADRDKHAK